MVLIYIIITDGSTGGGGLETVVAVADVGLVVRHLLRITSALLEDGDDPTTELQSAFKASHHLECVRKFVSDSQIRVLLVQRCSTKGKILFIHRAMWHIIHSSKGAISYLYF